MRPSIWGGAAVNYVLNYVWTFDSNKRHSEAALKFALEVTVGMALNTFAMTVFLWLGLHYLAAQVLATAIVLIWSFSGRGPAVPEPQLAGVDPELAGRGLDRVTRASHPAGRDVDRPAGQVGRQDQPQEALDRSPAP